MSASKNASIPFIDLAAQRRRIGPAIDAALVAVAEAGQYIMGPEVAKLEAELATFCGAAHVISCASGTDALILSLMAKGIGSGDAVLCPSFTFAATAEAVALVGATPVFVDIEADTFDMSATSLREGISTARAAGLRPVGIIVVDLFGQPADYDAIEAIAAENGLWILDDAAQAFGATYRGRAIGRIGQMTATSFFPAKPLGCYGDGGAIFTDDADLASILRSLRVHGQGSDKYDNVRIGLSGRLDTMQAAVLLEKLRVFPEEIVARDRIAATYGEGLAGDVIVPTVIEGATSVWAQYTIRLPAGTRDTVAAALKAVGIPTAVYYPKPLHLQTAYRHFPVAGNGLPVSEGVAEQVLSLPMHPYLDLPTQTRIIDEVRAAVRATR
ncbi:DegT/DnrJ/EryC1/StrS family aminotransferase [Pinisolibacter aquiterrae]|uniref:DegT/DnrJ/EryC1/StrS family aminotransferase n=1 Tax=Pinisolibacter aquiterrae TaxID=2815579 RepID=UPI001C3DC70E|nr:DegT/DnrJ/EryC1/StrS family aminotransferase [Pinisolibacter aquiterrae]MBV5265342.1 DegT/DnrJ/EryC1/StrS family aminotransferase [Pinisolibacter aquiterrae]MCC8235331.1 DegT/DnrJ/EryC1/StrS family aminotransferase [Pinisolibacter aquiterrae]